MRSLMLLSTAAIVAGLRPSPGQEIHWAEPAGGSWNTAANWQGGEIPDAPFENAVIDIAGAYTVDFDRSALLGGIRMRNTGATLVS